MSLAETRTEIADAVSTVDDLTGYAEPPSVMSTGDAWPLLSSLEAAGPAGVFMADWRLLLVLGSTPVDGLHFLDQVLDDLVDALIPVAAVVSVSPVNLTTTGGELYAAEIRLNRE